MAFTVGNAVRDILTELGQFNEGIATGGTTVTLVDSALAGADDDWNGGTVIITRDAAGAGAAPEGEFAPIDDYTSSTGTIAVTVANKFSAAPASGDGYAVATSYYPLRQVVRAVNRALMSLGDVPQVDTTTLDTAASKTEYACSVAWKRRPPYRIDIQTSTITNDFQWERTDDWEYIPATAGTSGLIVFGHQPPISKDIRVWFRDRHAEVNAYNDVIYEGFQPELVVWKGIYEALIWQRGRSGGTDDSVAEMLNKAEQQLGKLETVNPVWYPKRRSKILILRGSKDEGGIADPAPGVRT